MFTKRALPAPLLGFLLAILILLPFAAAQDLTAEQVLANLKDSVATIEDASFLLYGGLQTGDGTRHGVEVEVEVMPDLDLVRLYILQPDALADNFIILADDATSSYNYLTNQVVIYAADDPTPFGPLTGASTYDSKPFRFTLDFDELFSGWEVQLAARQQASYTLEFVNTDPAASIVSATVVIADSNWLPLGLSLLNSDGSVLAELEVQHLQVNQGLDSADLLWSPPDAEIIDERR